METPVHLPKQYSAGIHNFYTLGDGNSNISLSSFITLPPTHVMTMRSSNIGIGTTLPRDTLDFYGKSIFINGNLGIGTTYTRQRMDIVGDVYLSNANLGIGTSITNENFIINGSINVSQDIRIAQVSRNILDVPTVSAGGRYLRRSLDNTKHEYVSIQGLKRIGTYDFTTVGTSLYRPSSNAQIILAICLGGGGGGGGCESTDAAVRPAQGGRGGGYAARFINVSDLDIENGEIVTVGDGGAGGTGAPVNSYVNGITGSSSSFGSFVSAVGGGRALAVAATGWAGVPAGYASATAHIGACGSIQRRSGNVNESGTGGQSSYGAGATGRTTVGGGAAAADNTGAGGAGAYATGATARAGGAGGSGLVRVVEFGTDYKYIESELFPFSNFTFTPAGATLQSGPTLTQCQASYAGSPWLSKYFSLYNNIRGYQRWVVPSTGKYFIMAAGACGGKNLSRFGGMGSVVFTTTSLTMGETLTFIVGQMGQEGTTTQAAGGGGGTFIIRDGDTITYPLIAASGGGGAGNQTTGGNGRMYYNGRTIIKSTDAYPILITTTPSTSLAGTATTTGNQGSGYGQDVSSNLEAKGFANGLTGGFVTSGTYGGFGGGGAGLSNTISFTGGGGGGWCGGKASTTTGDGGYIGSSNFCINSFSGHIWHNMYKNTDGSGDGLIRIYKFTPSILSSFTITFTSCGISGGLGPTYNQMISYYNSVGSNLITDYLVNYLDYSGMQTWLVPKTGTYKITAVGANGQSHTTPGVGGKGGVISANFNLTEGEALLIVVGQCRSGTVTGTTAGAGGGASWVYRLFTPSIYYPTEPYPLIGAGGGGGAYSGLNGSDVTVADTFNTAASVSASLGGGASFLLNNDRSYGFFGHMENAVTLSTAYKYPFTNLDFTVGVFGGGGRSVVGNTTAGGGAGWRAGAQGAATGAAAGTCWSSNITYTYTGALNPRADGNGEVTIQLL